jgi:hypothetical protein
MRDIICFSHAKCFPRHAQKTSEKSILVLLRGQTGSLAWRQDQEDEGFDHGIDNRFHAEQCR